ncbi:hypothetical protein TNCV_4802271 [Trichonephila clavipes]|nr:hypothetical protein TNCV_4802271 [Trichonephila clavipes]
MELKWREISSSSPCTRDSAQKNSGPTDLTSTYSVCTRRIYGDTGIEPMPSSPNSGDHATRGLLATDHVILNHGQVMWTTSELAPPLLTTTPKGGRFSSRHI